MLADGGDEIRELTFERLFMRHIDPAPFDLRRPPILTNQAPVFQFLRGIVDRDVRVVLKPADLPHTVSADAACRQVRDTARGEAQPHVGNVYPIGQHRNANGFNRRHLGIDDREDDVEVMNHHIEDDIDIKAAVGKRPKPMDFDKFRSADQRHCGGHRGIEALGVADAKRRARSNRRADQPIGIVQ